MMMPRGLHEFRQGIDECSGPNEKTVFVHYTFNKANILDETGAAGALTPGRRRGVEFDYFTEDGRHGCARGTKDQMFSLAAHIFANNLRLLRAAGEERAATLVVSGNQVRFVGNNIFPNEEFIRGIIQSRWSN